MMRSFRRAGTGRPLLEELFLPRVLGALSAAVAGGSLVTLPAAAPAGPATIGCLIAGPGVALSKTEHPLIIVSRLGGAGRLPGTVGPLPAVGGRHE